MSLSLAEADTTALETEADEAAGGLWSDAFKRLRRNPAAIIGAILVVLFLAVEGARRDGDWQLVAAVSCQPARNSRRRASSETPTYYAPNRPRPL